MGRIRREFPGTEGKRTRHNLTLAVQTESGFQLRPARGPAGRDWIQAHEKPANDTTRCIQLHFQPPV